MFSPSAIHIDAAVPASTAALLNEAATSATRILARISNKAQQAVFLQTLSEWVNSNLTACEQSGDQSASAQG